MTQTNINNSIPNNSLSVNGDIYAQGITFDNGINILQFYEVGTWIPILNFGGASVGITYITQLGTFTRIGNLVICSCRITLSSKGTSTGNLMISGLPYIVSNDFLSPTAARSTYMILRIGYALDKYILTRARGDEIVMLTNLTGSIMAQTDGTITDNTEIIATLSYIAI